MTGYILDDLENYRAFSKRLERRVDRVAEAAEVEVQLLNNNIFNSYNHWLNEYEVAVSADKHIADNINILQMKIEILYRSLSSRRFINVEKKHPIPDVDSKVVYLFPSNTTDAFLSSAGKSDFQDFFATHPSQYLSIDFCTEIYRDFRRSRNEYPFGEGDQLARFAVRSAVKSLNYNSNQAFFRLMGFANLPINRPETA